MKVAEAIKKNNNFVITQRGYIMAINNSNGITLGEHSGITKDELLNLDVLSIDIINGQYANYIGVRV